MIVSRVKGEEVAAAGRDVGVRVQRLGGRPPNYVLHPAGHRFRNDRGNLCAHGYQAFFDALFAREPGARVQTAIADYQGRDHFERDRQRDLERALEMFPEACECEPWSEDELLGWMDGVCDDASDYVFDQEDYEEAVAHQQEWREENSKIIAMHPDLGEVLPPVEAIIRRFGSWEAAVRELAAYQRAGRQPGRREWVDCDPWS